MKVLIDTSVWSLALRKHANTESDIKTVSRLTDLVRDSRAAIIGAVRQELLSGISSGGKFKLLKEKMRAFEDLSINTDIYELAAEFSNKCRTGGIQGSHTDFLICAVAAHYDIPVFTLDKDFENYKSCIDLKLY
ncbi:MAG: PIN domain-containing protein [Deferribacterales bacterium]